LAAVYSAIEPTLTTERGRQLIAEIRLASGTYQAGARRVFDLRRAGKGSEALAELLKPAMAESRSTLEKDVNDISSLAGKLEKEAREQQLSAEAQATLWSAGLGFAGLVVGLGVAIFLSRGISRSASAMATMIHEVAGNNLLMADIKIDAQDELGRASVALNEMKNNLHSLIRAIAGAALQVTRVSDSLNANSERIAANSQETSAQARVVSNAADEVSRNLQTVATGAEEMGVSIREIAKNATEAARVATSAVKVAESTSAAISKLGESSNQIGQVIKVITSIAQQTNLLALNATIEAARAGEAGKGFAVVANEVKELAKETARATEDISRKIEAIQTDTKAAVGAIASITQVITQINNISGTIATAVEEQNATTNEMSRNVSEAAKSSGEINTNIAGVAEAADNTAHGSVETQGSVQQLVSTSEELKSLVARFKVNTDGAESAFETNSQNRSRAAHA